MYKSILFLFFLIVMPCFSIAQVDKGYAMKIEQILTFDKKDLKKIKESDEISKYVEDITDKLNRKITKAKKLKLNPDSVTTKTIAILELMKSYTDTSMVGFYEVYEKLVKRDDLLNDPVHYFRDIKTVEKILEDWNKFERELFKNTVALNMSSISLHKQNNKLRVSIGLEELPEESYPFHGFSKEYLSYFFTKMQFLKDTEEKKVNDLQVAKHKLFAMQDHRFQFINGILNYNNTVLFEGQSLTDLISVLGTDYVETQKEDTKNYSVVHFKKIPLSVTSSKGVIKHFKIYLKKNDKDAVRANYSYLGTDYIKLENYYMNRKVSSLFALESKIEKDLDRYFRISYDYRVQVFYSNSNDVNINLPDRSFHLYQDADSEFYRIAYSEDLDEDVIK